MNVQEREKLKSLVTETRSFLWDIEELTFLIIKENCCIPITFNNPLKVYFFNKKYMYYYNPNTPDTNCKSIFLVERFLKIIGVQI